MMDFGRIEINQLKKVVREITPLETRAIQQIEKTNEEEWNKEYIHYAARGMTKQLISNLIGICSRNEFFYCNLQLTLFKDGKVTLYSTLNTSNYFCYMIPKKLLNSEKWGLEFQLQLIQVMYKYLEVPTSYFDVKSFPRAQWNLWFYSESSK